MIFNGGDLEVLRRPHVGPSMFLEIDLPSGIRRFHNGAGNVTVGGLQWEGVTDPFGERAAIVQEIDYPEFGTAPAVVIPIVGCDATFMSYMRSNDATIEGRPARIYIAAIDPETMETAIPLRLIFRGRITGIKPVWEGIGTRTVVVVLESIWHARNFGYDGKWNDASQRRRFPGDKGQQYVGVKVTEFRK